MKKIILFIGILCLYNSASAWLFEYHLWVDTPSNASSSEGDTIESIDGYQEIEIYSQTYSSSYNSNYYTNSSYNSSNYYTELYSNSSYNRPYTESYYDNISHSNGYYSYSELKNYYEDRLDDLEDEADYIDDIKRDIKLSLSDLKKYNSRYYYDIKANLNAELDNLEEREVQVENMIDDIEDEIDDLEDNRGNSNSKYYNSGTYFDSWSNSYYDNRYNNYYYDRNYYNYDSDSWEYIPHWVNPDLEAVDNGYIYIR